MSTKTTNYNLIKPALEDFYNIGDFNSNSDIVDTELKRVDETVQAHRTNIENPHQTTAAQVGAIATSQKGAPSGVAELGENGKVLSAQLPSYVDDVLEYASKANFPSTGETGKIYVDTTTNLTYRWSGSAYVEISPSLALGETASTAYRGDKGEQNAANIASLQTLVNSLMSRFTPQVGEVELNFSGNNPASKYPGTTWIQRAQGRALVGVGSNGSYAYSSREQFGADLVTLSASQIPSHSHQLYVGYTGSTSHIHSGMTGYLSEAPAGNTPYAMGTEPTYGCGGAHENRQCSIALYVWERTA